MSNDRSRKSVGWRRGSMWGRWDPHIHTPETLMADGYTATAWSEFLDQLEAAPPSVVALGITDYFCLRGYKRVREAQQAGRLKNIPFIFPNVELRITPRVSGGNALNVHLLFCPDDPNHVSKIEEALATVLIRSSGENFPCSEAGLTRLGRMFLGEATSDAKAISEGARQFKIEANEILRLLEGNPWLRSNCLVAMPGNKDGPSGLQKDDGYKALRDSLAKTTDIVFSANPKDRAYWLGQGVDGPEELERRFRGPKPCLHGSDAHCLSEVLEPDLKRYCWIRAEPTWSGLKQVVHEPDQRVHIGSEAPERPRQNWISAIQVKSVDWFPGARLELNDGLVAIIGPRGSGKTAFADMVAFAADAHDDGPASFLSKAGEFAEGAEIVLEWADGREPSCRTTGVPPDSDWPRPPQVRYLSQHFVESLCSDQGGSDRLVDEIEKVIFDRLDPEARGEASSFAELRQMQSRSIRRRMADLSTEMRSCTAAIGRDNDVKAARPQMQVRMDTLLKDIAAKKAARDALASKVDPDKARRLELLSTAAADGAKRVFQISAQLRKLRDLRRDLATEAARLAADNSNRSAVLGEIGISGLDAARFVLRFADDFEPILKAREDELVAAHAHESGQGLSTDAYKVGTHAAAKRDLDVLQKTMAADAVKQKQYAELSKAVGVLEETKRKLELEMTSALDADKRMAEARDRRLKLYRELFGELAGEEAILRELYAPLHDWLKGEPEAERKLEFYVRRRVNLEVWAEQGEALLDLRKKGALNERGALVKLASTHLLKPWRSGDLDGLEKGMKAFVAELGDWRGLLAPSASSSSFGDWLFSTDHLDITYGIRYGGTEIDKLSPGTKGIVLLILYLAIDQEDDCPVIVDQPEENLDPQSIFRELVRYFRRARARRQVIIVTHNPNLVINTDADQVVVASSERVDGCELPRIRYAAGPLESPGVRSATCSILEGGEEAFRRRERRYELR